MPARRAAVGDVVNRRVDVETARSLISIGVDAALNAVRDVTTDRGAIVEAQVLTLLAREDRDRREKRAAAAARAKARDPDGYRARNLESVKRSRARRKGGDDG